MLVPLFCRVGVRKTFCLINCGRWYSVWPNAAVYGIIVFEMLLYVVLQSSIFSRYFLTSRSPFPIRQIGPCNGYKSRACWSKVNGCRNWNQSNANISSLNFDLSETNAFCLKLWILHYRSTGVAIFRHLQLSDSETESLKISGWCKLDFWDIRLSIFEFWI